MLKDKFPIQSQKVKVARNKGPIEKFPTLKSSPDIITILKQGMRCFESCRGKWET
jgi:hypothetical protein